MQNIQRPWRRKVEITAGPPHASVLVEQDRKKCEHAIRGEETQAIKPYERMNIFYIVSEMQNKMAIRYHSIPRHCKKN